MSVRVMVEFVGGPWDGTRRMVNASANWTEDDLGHEYVWEGNLGGDVRRFVYKGQKPWPEEAV